MNRFDEVRDVLGRDGADIGPSEAHGLLCGLLCSPQGSDMQAWIAQVCGSDTEPGAPGAVLELQELFDETAEQLADTEYGLRLLLPEDDEPLTLRAEALASWCRGFLYGLALAPGRPLDQASEVLAEVSQDFADIAGLASSTAHEGEEEDEQAYAELAEYVRTGAMLVYEELHGASPSPPD